MRGSQKRKIILAILLVLILGITGATFTILNKKIKKDSSVVLGQTDVTSIPYIISLSPVIGFVGSEYVYDVKYTDNDSDAKNISVSLDDAPVWLHIQDKHIYGTPPLGSEGQYKFKVRISDGENSSVQENYILIQTNAQQ